MAPPADTERFESNTGVRIYRVPCEAFPGFTAYVHLAIGAGPPTLIDTGSGFGPCNEQITRGIEGLRDKFAEQITLADIGRIVITHGHIDHFGGLSHLVEKTGAEVAIHGLDRGVIDAFDERVLLGKRGVSAFFARAGIPLERRDELLGMYSFSKAHVKGARVHRVLADGDRLDGLEFIHTPGHCPGQVCVAIGDILLTADHVLPHTTPHLSPESIFRSTGLAHFFASLDRVRARTEFRLALGGHEAPFTNLTTRIDEIRDSHLRKLDRVRAAIECSPAPPTAYEITISMYPRVSGFNQLLAIEQVGAQVEFLHEHGQARVANLDELEAGPHVGIRYRPV